MPVDEQDQQVDATETVPLSPEWGGVPVHGGDNADATGGPPTEAEPIELEADEDAAPVAEADDAAPDAESDADAAPVAEADAAPDAESDEDGEPEAEAVEASVGADA